MRACNYSLSENYSPPHDQEWKFPSPHLQLRQVFIQPLILQYQFAMGAAFFYGAVFYHQYIIGIAYSGKPVCHYKGCPVFH